MAVAPTDRDHVTGDVRVPSPRTMDPDEDEHFALQFAEACAE
jgi:hypothetical protein